MRNCLVGVALSVAGLAMTVDAGFAPVDPIRDWKVVYGSSEGPQGKALEVLTEAAGPILRDHRTSTSYVLPLEKDGGKPVAQRHRILVGRPSENAALRAALGDTDVPKGGYVVKTLSANGTNTVAIAGDTPSAVLWGAFDFTDLVLPQLAADSVLWHNMAYRGHFFAITSLVSSVRATAPATPVRSLFTWGHVIDDYRNTFKEMARNRYNRVILWNEYPPVNAVDVVREAHAWGIEVFWGFAWGWSTDCRDADLSQTAKIGDSVVREWDEVWSKLPGDGIYFQSFTEVGTERIGGRLVADCVVDLVNDTTRRIRQRRPNLPIVFGLHARAVMKHLATIERTDPSIDILWENCGDFPFEGGGAAHPVRPTDYHVFVERLLDSPRNVGLAWKVQVLQDWNCWAHQAGPYLLGCAGKRLLARDRDVIERLQGAYDEDWIALGGFVRDFVRQLRAAPKPPHELNTVAEYNPPFAFSTMLQAELFWGSDDSWEEIARRVRMRERAANGR